MIKNLNAYQRMTNGASKKTKANVSIGGQCCYEEGSSGLLTIETEDCSIEVQLSYEQCLSMSERLSWDAAPSAIRKNVRIDFL